MNIINFGSLNIDYVYSIEHFAVPGETVAADKLETFFGGKGLNQSIAAARAGAHVLHVGKVGAKDAKLREELKKNHVDVAFVSQSSLQSGHAIIQVDPSGQNSIMIYGGANLDIDKDLVNSALNAVEKDDIVLLQNEISNNAYIMEQVHSRELRIAFNPSPITDNIMEYPLQNVNWFILNEIEGEKLTGKSAPYDIAGELLRKYPGCAVVLTLGKDGVLYEDDSTLLQHGIYDVQRVDSTGAGDTFTGYFLAGVAKGHSVKQCLEEASIASSIVVSRKGASPSIPTIEEVRYANLPLLPRRI